MLQDALKLFRRVGDRANEALMHSNLGRVSRIQVYANADGELTLKERELMNKVIFIISTQQTLFEKLLRGK